MDFSHNFAYHFIRLTINFTDMKKYFGLQKVILALTTLTLVGLSSCNDQNFDWDEAHATQQYEKFSNVFIEKFGKPAEGHQWGYDLARLAMSDETVIPSTTRAQKDHFFKQDMDLKGVRISLLYAPPSNIKLNEHEDVFAWFSTHKVDWQDEHNPSYYGKEIDSNGNVLNTRKTNLDFVSLDFGWYQQHVDPKINSIDDIQKLDKDHYRGYRTITKYSADKCGKYVTNASQDLNFHNGWIQSVAHDETPEVGQKSTNGTSSTCFNMDYLNFRGLEETGTAWASHHTLDFNAGQGYGWFSVQNADTTKNVVTDRIQNAGFYLNVDFNDVTYHCSTDSRPHDKFLLVYLKGDDGNNNTWEGWYLGFDLEGYMAADETANTNKYLKADGFCNDWIIKITNAGNTVYGNSRIMCEDLGGTINKNSSDIDYNDIVIDVSYDQNNGKYVDITPKCAGGTLPILICYDDVPLFEVHEYLLATDNERRVYNKDASYRLSESQYKTMINTWGDKTENQNKGNFETVAWTPSYRLLFGETQNTTNFYKDLSSKGKFDIDKLQIKVYRHNLDDYVSNPGTISPADWISLDKLETGVPLKFIVPQRNSNWQEIKWLQERQMITYGYHDFNDWVANPALWFWENVPKEDGSTHAVEIDETYLY